MQVSGTRKFVANLGNYGERYEASRSVTADHSDLGYTNDEWFEHVQEVGSEAACEELADFVMEQVNAELEGELEEANALRDPEEDSFLLRIFPPKSKKRRSRRS